MKKTSEVLFKISTILGAICAGIMLAVSPFELVFGFSPRIHEMLVEAYSDGNINTSFELNGESFATLIQTICAVTGILLVILGVLCVVASILGVRLRKQATRGSLIAAIVIGAISIDTLIVGAIFGLIALNKEDKRE